MIGSAYEFYNTRDFNFELFTSRSRFTDDTVLTVAIADAILCHKPYAQCLYEWGRLFPRAGYGPGFRKWLNSADHLPYMSMGNGAAMRVSPVSWSFDSLYRVQLEASFTATPSHNHPEGIKGAQIVAGLVFLARSGVSKQDMLLSWCNVPPDPLAEYRSPLRGRDRTCSQTVPIAFRAFLDSTDFLSAIRNAVSVGGDSDTIACITGAIAEAYYRKIPDYIIRQVRSCLHKSLLVVLDKFEKRYGCGY